MYTAFFYTKQNIELEEKIKYLCKKYCIDIFVIKDLREMLLKGSCLQKYVLIVDTTTVSISADLIDYMLWQNGNPKLIGILLLSDSNYQNICIDNNHVFKVELGEKFNSDFVAKAFILNDSKPINPHSSISDIEGMVYNHLVENKLIIKYSGFGYIKQALIYCLAEGGNVDNLTTSIYPYIATQNNTSVNNVERNIRIAIECSWLKNNGLPNFSSKPSNKEYLVNMVEQFKQKLNKLA